MVALTTLQRDLLLLLLTADGPLALSGLGQSVGMTARQVQYSLRAVDSWLDQRDAQLLRRPGVGVQIVCGAAAREAMIGELTGQRSFQLVLTAGQRHQILALQLLTATEPSILYQLQQCVDVSRTTILKDLDVVGAWFDRYNLVLERRPNFGCWLGEDELAQRQALAALLSGAAPFDDPMFAVTHVHGLVFLPFSDAGLSPSVKRVHELVRGWDLRTTARLLTFAETELGVRYTDEAILHMSLAFAIQEQRAAQGRRLDIGDDTLEWLRMRPVWPIAQQIGKRLAPGDDEQILRSEQALAAMYLLSATVESGGLHNLATEKRFRQLIGELMQLVAEAYRAPQLANDRTLRDGLEAHIIPACMRQRFGLWFPATTYDQALAEHWEFERGVAKQLAESVAAQMGFELPPSEQYNLMLLVRAAAIRARSEHPLRVLVCCPSGMATTQILVARLRIRFPHLGQLEVLSLRNLTLEQIRNADLIITTVPLTLPTGADIDVLKVQPLLPPDDIDTIRQWIAHHSDGRARFPA